MASVSCLLSAEIVGAKNSTCVTVNYHNSTFEDNVKLKVVRGEGKMEKMVIFENHLALKSANIVDRLLRAEGTKPLL